MAKNWYQLLVSTNLVGCRMSRLFLLINTVLTVSLPITEFKKDVKLEFQNVYLLKKPFADVLEKEVLKI